MIGFPGARSGFYHWVDEHGARYPLARSGLGRKGLMAMADLSRNPRSTRCSSVSAGPVPYGAGTHATGLQVVALRAGREP